MKEPAIVLVIACLALSMTATLLGWAVVRSSSAEPVPNHQPCLELGCAR